MNWFLGHMHWNWCWRSGGCYSNLTETERLSWDISEIWAGKIHLIVIIFSWFLFFILEPSDILKFFLGSTIFDTVHYKLWLYEEKEMEVSDIGGERDGCLWYSVTYCMMNTFIRDHCSVTSVVVQLEWERSAVWILVVTDVF